MSESSADPIDLPSTVGRYEIRSRLSSDPLHEVYLGFDPLIERPVAVKVFPLRGAMPEATAGVRETFGREMARAGILAHPSIVSLYDAGVWPGGLFIANEYVDGRALGDELAAATERDLPLRVSLLVQIVDALEHARELDVAHLDLKPSNIFVATDDMLKVGGFGVAPVVDALITALGRPRTVTRYLAPERAAGAAGDFRSDAYAIAQIALDILAGPHRAVPADGWSSPPPLPAMLVAHGVRADRWEALFEHALAEDPADRFPTAGIFSTELLMRLELSESEARLAWETSRAMGALGMPDASLAEAVDAAESATILGSPLARPGDASTTTTTAAAPSYEHPHADAETILGLPAERRAAPPATRGDE